MTSSSTAKFWFLLLDSATGQPYKGTTADFVFLPSGANVAEFRKLVHLENSNKLPCVEFTLRNSSPTFGDPFSSRRIRAKCMSVSIPSKYGR